MEIHITSAQIAIAFVSFLVGFTTHFLLSSHDVSLEKRTALVILTTWLSFLAISFAADKELGFFFNAAGMGAVGNLLGMKTGEIITNAIKRK